MSLLLQSRSLREPASRKMGKSISFSFPFFRQACVLFLFFLILPFPPPGCITARVLQQVATTRGLFFEKCLPPHFYAFRTCRMVLTA